MALMKCSIFEALSSRKLYKKFSSYLTVNTTSPSRRRAN